MKRALSQSNYFSTIPSSFDIARKSKTAKQNLMMVKTHGFNSMYMNQGLNLSAGITAAELVRGTPLSEKQKQKIKHYKSHIRDFGGSSLMQRKSDYVSVNNYTTLFQNNDNVQRDSEMKQYAKSEAEKQTKILKR